MHQTNHVIYELEEDDDPKFSATPKNSQPQKIERKLGAVSYIKWGTLYNYYFSFNLKKARLLCYKTLNSQSYNNYYSLNRGDFVKEESEIAKFEYKLKKRKHYQQINESHLVIYVRTAKGRKFKLVVNKDENFDKIIGYLQLCFSSKIQTVNSFYALLGIGIVKVNEWEFKLTTGVLVSLKDWSKNNTNYLLNQNEVGLNLLISNIELLGGIIGAYYQMHELFAIIFNPSNQTVDIILFDRLQQPKILYQAMFKLAKISKLNRSIKPSGRGYFLKLKTDQNEFIETQYIEIAQNENVKIYIHQNYLKECDYALVQGSMLSASYLDDQNDIEGDKLITNNVLEYYKKEYKYYGQKDDETKEFIVVNRQSQAVNINIASPRANVKQHSIVVDDINDEQQGNGVQLAKTIKVHMHRAEKYINLQEISPPRLEFIQEFHTGCFAEVIQEEKEQIEQKENQNNRGSFIKQENNEEESDELDLVKASIVFDEREHCQFRDAVSIFNYATQFKRIDYKDEWRVEIAHKSGGVACKDKKMIDLARSVGKDMIKQIGQKLLSGNFNLTTVSFPIKAMIPKSALEKTFMQAITFPLYMNKAASISSPLERMKLSIVALLSNYIQANSFLKPLNPILGETFEGGFEDGTQLYCDQISHHPPLSYFLVYGPKKSYRFYGSSLYEAKAGLNSLTILNHGKRTIEFHDQKIQCTFPSEHYSGTFFGTMKMESQGQIQFYDEQNNLKCLIQLGKVKNRPTDYFEGEIKTGKTTLSKLYGSYLGFADFDGIRYWDARVIKPFAMQILKSNLESDHTKRSDRICMVSGDMEKAQLEKERLEQRQRTDGALRKAEKIKKKVK